MKKRMTAVLLALLAVLTACAAAPETDGEASETDPQVSAGTTDPAQTEPETEPVRFVPDVPAADFGGESFCAGGIEPSFAPALLLDFDFEEDSGEVVESAIFNRNRRIESDYNVTLECAYLADYNKTRTTLEQCARAGDGTYQLMMLICREAFPASLNGSAMPYEEIPYLDFTQPWYMHRINDMMTVAGHTVLAYSDMCMNAYLQTVCALFNKEVLAASGLEDPYTLVREGTWTTEKFYEMARSVILDADGDGSFGKGDTFGVISEPDMFFPAMWVGADTMSVTKDDDDIPSFTAPYSEKFIGILDRLTEELKTDGLFCNDFKLFESTDNGRSIGNAYFAENGGLFRVGCVGYVSQLRDMEADFGILPLPKHDEAQSMYYGRMIDGWLHIVPNTEQNTELLGTMMEVLGAESRNYVIPAYFDIALTYKFTRDSDSEDMLSMIFDNVMVDLGDTVWYDRIRAPLQGEIEQLNGNYESYMKRNEKVIVKTIDKALSSLTD